MNNIFSKKIKFLNILKIYVIIATWSININCRKYQINQIYAYAQFNLS